MKTLHYSFLALLALMGGNASAAIVLDNTSGLTSAFQGSGGTISDSSYPYLTFTTDSDDWTLSSVSIGYQTFDNNSVTLSLYSTDGNNKPDTELASVTENVARTNPATYLTFDLTGEGFDVAASTSYSLALSGTSTFALWNRTTPEVQPSGTFTFVGVSNSSDGGQSWGSPGISKNAIQINADIDAGNPAAVALPSALWLLTPGLAGLIRVRRRLNSLSVIR